MKKKTVNSSESVSFLRWNISYRTIYKMHLKKGKVWPSNPSDVASIFLWVEYYYDILKGKLLTAQTVSNFFSFPSILYDCNLTLYTFSYVFGFNLVLSDISSSVWLEGYILFYYPLSFLFFSFSNFRYHYQVWNIALWKSWMHWLWDRSTHKEMLLCQREETTNLQSQLTSLSEESLCWYFCWRNSSQESRKKRGEEEST